MKKVILIVTVILLAINLSYAVDLNAPAEKKITIASEIERGASAISDAELQSSVHASDIYGQIQLYNKIITFNKQHNTDTEAFYLGVYFVAWTSLDITLGIAQHSKLYDPKEVQMAQSMATIYFKEFRKIQKKLDIDDKTLIQILKMNKDVIIPKIYRWDKLTKN